MKSIRFRVAGTSYRNQAHIARLTRQLIRGSQADETRGTESVYLVNSGVTMTRESNNPHDRNAVRLFVDGIWIGYVPRSDSSEVACRIDGGRSMQCRLERVHVDPARDGLSIWFDAVVQEVPRDAATRTRC